MIKIEYMKPFFTKYSGNKLRVVFAYQYLSIMKEDELFHFIPIEGKIIEIDILTRQVSNLSEVFVFQRGNKFIRLPLYQLLLISNILEHLDPIIDGSVPKDALVSAARSVRMVTNEEVDELISFLEKDQILRAIDVSLDRRDEETFNELVRKLHALENPNVLEELTEEVS